MTAIRYNYSLQAELRNIIRAIMAPGKGVLACDESEAMMGKQFQVIGLPNTDETRRQYRQMLFTCDEKLTEYVTSVIVYYQSLYHIADDGKLFIDHLKKKNLVVGIKMDKGVMPLIDSADFITLGMDSLYIHCAAYKKDGCDFAKWKALFRIGPSSPSHQAIIDNVNLMAFFAGVCQMNRMVPMLHVEVLQEGDFDIEQSQATLERILCALFKSLHDHSLYMEGLLLTTNMVGGSQEGAAKNTPAEIATATIEALRRSVPPSVPGVLLVSGGHSEEHSTIILNEICKSNLAKPYWQMSFCFGRAMQASALRGWGGKPELVKTAQNELLKRAEANGLAVKGSYTPGLIKSLAATESLYITKDFY